MGQRLSASSPRRAEQPLVLSLLLSAAAVLAVVRYLTGVREGSRAVAVEPGIAGAGVGVGVGVGVGAVSLVGGSFALPRPAGASRPALAPRAAAAPAGAIGGRVQTSAQARVRDLSWWLSIGAVTTVALVLRLLNHSSNYDVFLDEITYSTLGQAVALGHGASLYGTPFFLHPPLFFYLSGVLLDIFGGAHAAPVQLVLELRPINCVIGAIECALMMMLVARFTNRRAALVVGMFEAVDPFLLLWDGRVLLETLAMTTAVAGWLVLERIARREAAAALSGARRDSTDNRLIVIGGLCFGASLLSKETYAFVGIVPLVAMFVIGSPLPRRITGAMAALTIGCYVAFLLTVVISGHLGLWWNQNTAGFARALGTKQISGFNQAGGHHAGFGSRAGANLSLYLISYLSIMAVGVTAAVGVIRWALAARAGRLLSVQRRLAIALGAGCVGYVGYAVVFGAFEVQIFYMCIVGGLPVLATEVVGSAGLTRRSGGRLGSARRLRSARRWLLIPCVALASVALAFELAADVRLRAEKDTSLAQLVAYVQHHVPNLALVDSTDGVTQFVLQGVRIDAPLTVRGLERDRPDYVVVGAGLVNQGYVTLGPGFQHWLDAHARVVYTVTSRSTGKILLYRTVYAAHDRLLHGAAAGAGSAAAR